MSRWAVIAVVAFVVVDIVLVVWAVAAVRTPPSDPPAAATTTTAATAPASTPTATSTAAPTATAKPAAAPAAVTPNRILAAVDANTAWRASTGACPTTQASLQVTTDGGKTWKTSDASAPTGASSPVRILATDGSEASVVTLNGQGCAPQFVRTYVAGDNWAEYPDELAGTWFVDPRNASTVHSPNGDVKAPCSKVVGLAARDTEHAAVLCSNHSVYRTSNAGGGWGAALIVPGAVALSSSGSGYIAAATGDQTCSGVTTSSFKAASGGLEQGGCFASGTPKRGAVAISDGGGATWLWAGGKLGRSSDGGATWQ